MAIVVVLVLTLVSFAGSTMYAQHLAAKVDANAAYIATNASPSIEHLTQARRELLQLQVSAERAVRKRQTGANFDRTIFDRALAALNERFSAYEALPRFAREDSLAEAAEQALERVETTTSELIDGITAAESPAALQKRIGESTVSFLRADEAIERLVSFNAEEEHQLGLEIPKLRARAAHVLYLLQGVSAVLALTLMTLVARAARQYAGFLDAQRHSSDRRAQELAVFNERLQALVRAAVGISDTIRRSTHDLGPLFQTLADQARLVANADACALGLAGEGDPAAAVSVASLPVSTAARATDASATPAAATPGSPRAGAWVVSGLSIQAAAALFRGPAASTSASRLGASLGQPGSSRSWDSSERLLDDGRGFGPSLAVPVRHEDDVVATIYLARYEGRSPFGERELRVIELLAAYAAVAIVNARLYREARSAIRAREDLLATVSHDLKNPLSVIRMSAGLAREKTGDRGAELIARIDRAAERMTHLISDLLDAAKLESGQLRMVKRRESVAALLGDVEESFRPLATERGLVLETKPASPELHVECDRERLLRVFSNLLGNAIKFTSAGGRIELAVSTSDDANLLEFSVADEGVGIAGAKLSHIFERYWQEEPGDRRGSGLGLYIAKGIVEAHGGRIWVTSTPGQGTRVSFTVPKSPTAPL